MNSVLEPRKRALLVVYTRYVEADREWRLAQREARKWFPASSRPLTPLIGHAGSRIRQLYDRRNRALVQLAAAQQKLHAARQRARKKIFLHALPAY